MACFLYNSSVWFFLDVRVTCCNRICCAECLQCGFLLGRHWLRHLPSCWKVLWSLLWDTGDHGAAFIMHAYFSWKVLHKMIFLWISNVCQCHSVCGHYYKSRCFCQNNYVSFVRSVFIIVKILQEDFFPTCVNIPEKEPPIWRHLYVIKHF